MNGAAMKKAFRGQRERQVINFLLNQIEKVPIFQQRILQQEAPVSNLFDKHLMCAAGYFSLTEVGVLSRCISASMKVL